MSRPRPGWILPAVFAAGLAAGVCLQHLWPLGRLRDAWARRHVAVPVSLADLARLAPARRLVLVCVGQSNAANYGQPRRSAGAGVYAFADHRLFVAVDPLPGGDGSGGSVWTRLGARLALLGRHEAVILAVVAQGSTTASAWAPGGGHHARLADTFHQLAGAGLPVDFVLWQQGEQEGSTAAASGPVYASTLASIQAECRRLAPPALFLVAQSSLTKNPVTNEQIRLAQAAAATFPGAAPGPDLDQLGAAFRRDGTHFNARGLDAAADLWLASLRAPLALRAAAAPAP